jgi:type II protein arginine methyltransferase
MVWMLILDSSGLAGYFEAVLYGNIGLSIHPERKDEISKDMLSWFPLFFPFKVRTL